MQRYDWRYREPDYGAVARLAAELDLSPAAAEVLLNRGIESPAAAHLLLNGHLEDVASPWELPGMEEAVQQVAAALSSGEKILVYGDYDADGVTGTSLLVDFLRRLGGNAGYYIPDRFDEGYGLHAEALSRAREEGYSLVITVDCGITALEEAELARQIDLDLIITDHHRRLERLPAGRAVVYDPAYLLAGAGVAYKFVTALALTLDSPVTPGDYLDLAAIGTLADVAPLRGDNHLLVRHGLLALAASSRPGLKALLEVAGLQGKEVTVSGVLFQLAPRINAAGRLQHARRAVELLLAESGQVAWEIASSLDQVNRQRQVIEGQMLQEAMPGAEEAVARGQRVIILSSPLWHEGLVGLVAGRLARAFSRPAILLVERDGVCRGSGRSIAGVDLYQVLHDNQEVLVAYGGHAMACGIAVTTENLAALVWRLNTWAEAHLPDFFRLPALPVAAELLWPQVNRQLLAEVGRMQPFGEGNPEPVFVLRHLPVAGVRRVGSEGEHLKLTLEPQGQALPAIGFGLGELAASLTPGAELDVAVTLQHDRWNGQDNLQLTLMAVNIVTAPAPDADEVKTCGFTAADVLSALPRTPVILGLSGMAAATIRRNLLQQAIARDGRAVLICPSRQQAWQHYQQYRTRLPCLVGDGSRSDYQARVILDRFASQGGLLIATCSFWEHYAGDQLTPVVVVDGLGEEEFGLALVERLLGRGLPLVVIPEPCFMPAVLAQAARGTARVMGTAASSCRLSVVTGQPPALAEMAASGATLVVAGGRKQAAQVATRLRAGSPGVTSRILELTRSLWYTYWGKIIRQFNQGIWRVIVAPMSLAAELNGLAANQVACLVTPFSRAEFSQQVAVGAGETASVYFPDLELSLQYNREVLQKICPDREAIHRFYSALVRGPDAQQRRPGQMPYTWRAIFAILDELGLVAVAPDGRYRLNRAPNRVDLASSWRYNEARREWYRWQSWQEELNSGAEIVV